MAQEDWSLPIWLRSFQMMNWIHLEILSEFLHCSICKTTIAPLDVEHNVAELLREVSEATGSGTA